MTQQTVLDDIRKRPGSGDVIPVINPATEETITEFTDCGPEAVNEAVARAKASFEAGVWSQLPGRERAKVLWKVGDLIEVKDASREMIMVLEAKDLAERDVPEFYEVQDGKSAKLIRIPLPAEVPYPVVMEPNLVIEFYSR